MPPLPPDVKQAYAKLEEALEGLLRLRGYEGVLVEYVTLATLQSYDDEGDMTASVSMVLPMGGGTMPYHRVLGLVDYTQTVLRAEVARNELGAFNDDDDTG
jgi:hypothetical protein